MSERNILASLLAPAAQPMGGQNMLSRLLLDAPSPGADMPPTPGYAEARNPQPTRPGWREIVAETLDPNTRGNRIVGGFTGPAAIRAFHGSPHRFDRFDMSRINTGEGAQAYGHGLYFAEAENVARQYRDTLTPYHRARALREPQANAMRVEDEMLADARRRGINVGSGEGWGDLAPQYPDWFRREWQPRLDGAQREIQAAAQQAPTGSMYEVNLRVDPNRLLDWDAPMGQQPRGTQDALREILYWQRGARDALDAHRSVYGEPTGRHVYSALEGLVPPTDGRAFAGNQQGARFAAEELRDAGIPGIRYLDGDSRSGGSGTRNFVMFDDNLIDIVRRYGLLALLGGGGAAAATGAEAAQ